MEDKRRKIENLVFHNNTSVTISIGIGKSNNETSNKIINKMDKILYIVKK